MGLHMRFFKFLIIAIIFCSWQTSYAWNFIGHAVIAQIAYDNLTPKTKHKVDALVMVFSKTYPKVNSFQKLADWPDTIKNDGVNEFSSWHFIDKPFSPDGTRLPYYPKHNVAWAIVQFQQTLVTAQQPFNKALALAFLSHFVGDIEQPLHCATRVTKALPKGDRGGNLYPVKTAYANNLHSMWDQGVGLFVYKPNKSVPKQIHHLVTTIEQQYPKSHFKVALKQKNSYLWAKYSFNTAKHFVYSTPKNKIPSRHYIMNSDNVVRRQVALAGYRLAALLKQVVGNK